VTLLQFIVESQHGELPYWVPRPPYMGYPILEEFEVNAQEPTLQFLKKIQQDATM